MLKTSWPSFSFEFMPPRSQEEVIRLFATIAELQEMTPTFVCVTCRHSSRDATAELVGRLRRETGFEVMAHLVCYGSTRTEIGDLLDQLQFYGVDNILALRGDIEDESIYERSVRDGLANASDLVELIARRGTFSIGAACYPEGLDQVDGLDDAVRYAKLKQDAGASFLITQLFFDNHSYFSYVKAARAAGITVPILPGIFPITSAKQLGAVRRMGAVPEQLEAEIRARTDDPGAVAQFGVAWATLQCTNLLAGGAPGIHFYTFNRSPATRAILGALRAAKPWEWKYAIEVA